MKKLKYKNTSTDKIIISLALYSQYMCLTMGHCNFEFSSTCFVQHCNKKKCSIYGTMESPHQTFHINYLLFFFFKMNVNSFYEVKRTIGLRR